MHDPMTLAFKIKSPFRTEQLTISKKSKEGERVRPVIITIWHKDPCSDGSDDSCGWFMRARHGDKDMLAKIKNEFDFNFKHNYWFDKNGKQIFSTIGTLVQMYSSATWLYFDRNKKKQQKFMRKYLYDIMKFAENPTDCGGDSITNRWNCENHEERFGGLAAMVYSDICRKEQKWYQHPRWHVHHWRIKLNFVQRRKNKKHYAKNKLNSKPNR